jgi:MFS family permease
MSYVEAAPGRPAESAAGLPMPRWRARVILGAALTTLLLALLDTTIVTTAAPAIARDFGGGALRQVPWLTAAYALAETVAQPLYGKLTDRHGPRPVLLVALSLFTLGSLACGLSTSMTELVGLRVVQGLGSAGLLSVTFVLLGHLRAGADEPGSGGSLPASVLLAVGLIAGPLAGGSIVAHIDWRWVFWVNLPACAVVLVVMAVWLRLPAERRPEPVDWPAAALLAMAAGAVQLVFTWGGTTYPWASWPVALTAAAAVTAATGFAVRQRRSAHPFYPPYLLRHPVLRGVSLLQLAIGIGMAAGTIYLTLDMQLVHHYSPARAGLLLIPMAAGVVLGAAAGTVVLRRGRSLRLSLVVANALCAAAFTLLAVTVTASPVLSVWIALPVLGAGIGLGIGNELLIVQGAVPLRDLGTATTGVRFVETLGTSAGAVTFATVFTHVAAGPATAGSLAHAITVVFALGTALMAVASWVASRLPASLTVTPPRG